MARQHRLGIGVSPGHVHLKEGSTVGQDDIFTEGPQVLEKHSKSKTRR